MEQMQAYSRNHHQNRLLMTPNNSNSPPEKPAEISDRGNSESLHDYPQEITWLFFRDNKWIPFQSNNHYKIEQAFTLGGKFYV